MRHLLARGLLCVVFSLTLANAQTARPAPDATGSVSGHVYCADTNQPARFATVTLQPAPDSKETPGYVGPPGTRTDLDGSYFISKVKPGTYFLIAEYAGYVSPVATFAPEDLTSDDPADIEKSRKP